MFLAQMREELCWHNTLMQPVRGMNQRSNVKSSRSYKICEVNIYIYLSMWKVHKFQEKIGWCQAMTKGTVYCQMGRSILIFRFIFFNWFA